MSKASSLNTVGRIARELHVPVHRILYLVETRNIQPIARAGHIRVFSDADVELIRHELKRVQAEGKGVAAL